MVQYFQFRNLFCICIDIADMLRIQNCYEEWRGLWWAMRNEYSFQLADLLRIPRFPWPSCRLFMMYFTMRGMTQKNSPPRNLQKQSADDMTRCGHLVDLMSKETKNSGLPLRMDSVCQVPRSLHAELFAETRTVHGSHIRNSHSLTLDYFSSNFTFWNWSIATSVNCHACFFL
jgi:hypothetical protein